MGWSLDQPTCIPPATLYGLIVIVQETKWCFLLGYFKLSNKRLKLIWKNWAKSCAIFFENLNFYHVHIILKIHFIFYIFYKIIFCFCFLIVIRRMSFMLFGQIYKKSSSTILIWINISMESIKNMVIYIIFDI